MTRLQTIFADAFGAKANEAAARGDVRLGHHLAELAHEIAGIPDDDPASPASPDGPDAPKPAPVTPSPQSPAPAGAAAAPEEAMAS